VRSIYLFSESDSDSWNPYKTMSLFQVQKLILYSVNVDSSRASLPCIHTVDGECSNFPQYIKAGFQQITSRNYTNYAFMSYIIVLFGDIGVQ